MVLGLPASIFTYAFGAHADEEEEVEDDDDDDDDDDVVALCGRELLCLPASLH